MMISDGFLRAVTLIMAGLITATNHLVPEMGEMKNTKYGFSASGFT